MQSARWMSHIFLLFILDIFSECKDCNKCPPGFCGEGCVNTCECTTNAYCHPIKCCVCNKGFNGKLCDTR